MKKQLLLLMMMLLPMVVCADAIELDGIYYNLTSNGKKAEVTSNPNKYSGSVVIPEMVEYKGTKYSVTSIGSSAFLNCNDLTSIKIPSSVTNIGEWAFQSCCGLTSIKIPSSVTNIGELAFGNCENVEEIIVDDGNKYYDSRNNCNSIIRSNDNELIAACNNTFIPNTIKSIGESSFSSCKKMIAINIPNSVESIGSYAFSGCIKLKSLTVGSNIKTIGTRAFYYCSALKDFYCYAVQLPETKSEAFNTYYYTKYITLHVPTPVIETYKQAEPWSKFKEVVSLQMATITAKVVDVTREYGEENPQFAITYSGFVNGDDESIITVKPIVSTTATKTSDVGEYPILINGGYVEDYILYQVPGVLTISKAPLTAKVNDLTRQYGEENPTFSVNYVGLKNNETEPTWTENLKLESIATKQSDVGTYDITATGVPINYELPNIEDGILTITPAPLTITANDITKLYYSNTPTFSYTCSGCVNGDDINALITKPTLITSATFSSNVGTYDIDVEGASSNNYSISYVKGILSITPRTLTASVGNYERVYNEENPEFVVTYDGFVGDDDENILTKKALAMTPATKKSDVGTYIINVSGGTADNYVLSYITGTLTINKADQNIIWNQYMGGLRVGDQVELKAEASSELPVTYIIEKGDAAEIYMAGNRTFLDCLNKGQLVICAVQPGNENYYPSPRVKKTFNILLAEEGDVNGDGNIDIADAICIVNHIIGKPTLLFLESAADVNCDGTIDIADAVCLVNFVIGKNNFLSRPTDRIWDEQEPQ